MALWKPASVSVQPEVTLRDWKILETERGERHFAGYCLENLEGRVSSAIQQLDPATRLGMTRSGRIYQLLGEPGANDDALYVWAIWVRINGVAQWRDVTQELFPQG